MSVDPDKLYLIRSKPKHDSHSDAIRHFEADYECLSNTYKCPVSLRGDLEPYPSVEHALQASKTDDAELKDSIRQAKNAIEAKKIARVVKPAPEWRAGSERIVEALIRDKFRRNAKAREVLLGTGRVKLVYTNSHDDRVWGVCGGKGDNKLGKLLERVRADALAGKDTEVWCAMRFQLATPLDVAVDFAVTKGGEVVAEPSFEAKPIIRMGKLTDNEVVMAHPSVSRSHALLVVDRTFGAFLVDLGASNGSFLDGRRVTPYVPEPVKAGGALLTFAKSKRTYMLTRVETGLREAKKSQLYANMSDPTASVGQPEPDSTIYVGNLEPSVTEDDLREFFADCGDIASIRIPQDKDTGRMRGIAFVAFTKHVGVLQALALHMDDLKGQSIKIRRADANKADSGKTSKKKPHPRPPGGGGGPGGPDAAGNASSGAAKGRGGWGEKNPVGTGPSSGGGGGGVGGAGALSQSSALELATAAIIRAAEAARSNAAAAAGAAVALPASGSESKRRRLGDERDGASSMAGEERAGSNGHRRKRGNRWGDSADQESGNSHLAAAPRSVDDRETEAKRRRTGAGRREEREAEGVPRHKEGMSRDESRRGAGGGGHGDLYGGGRDGGHGRDRKGEGGRWGSEGGGGGGGGSGDVSGARAALDGRDDGEINRNYRGKSGSGGGGGGSSGGGGGGDRRGERQRDNTGASSERHDGSRDERRRREKTGDNNNGHRGHGKTDRDRREHEDGRGGGGGGVDSSSRDADRRRGGTARREAGDKKVRSSRRSEEGGGGRDREGPGRDMGHGHILDEGRRRDAHRESGKSREGSTRGGAEDGRKPRGSRDQGGRTARRVDRRSRSRSRSPRCSRG